jgi:hypothetical protein
MMLGAINRRSIGFAKTVLGSTRATAGMASSLCPSSSSLASSFETHRWRDTPQDEVLDPPGEERGNAVRLEP